MILCKKRSFFKKGCYFFTDPRYTEQASTEISDRSLELTLPFIRAGISEMALTAQLEYFMKTNGAEGLSFDTMVLSGKKTSLLHGQPGSKVLEKSHFVLFDFGAIYKGYHADIWCTGYGSRC